MRIYATSVTQEFAKQDKNLSKRMKCKACEVAETRSLLKVNEDFRNERNAAIHSFGNFFSTCGPYNPRTYTPYKPQVHRWYATRQCLDAIYR